MHSEKEFSFTIVGNVTDPSGNPMPYKRLTQKSKHMARGVGYAEWKAYVVDCFLKSIPDRKDRNAFEQSLVRRNKPIELDKMQDAKLTIHIRFKTENHGDPSNIVKGIEDALFADDKHVDVHTSHECRCEHGEVEVKIKIK